MNRCSITEPIVYNFALEIVKQVFNLKSMLTMSEQIKNKLWSVVENSNVYSFQENPLPIFLTFVIHYLKCANNTIEIFSSENWLNFLTALKEEVELKSTEDSKRFCESFSNILSEEIGEDNTILANLVEFFVDKYTEQEKENSYSLIMTSNLLDFIYWYAVGYEATTTELAIFNPFAGLGAFGTRHSDALNSQLQHVIDDSENADIQESKATFKECAHYYGSEVNKTLRMIGLVRLLVNNPMNLEQMFIFDEDYQNKDWSDFCGEWTLMTVPPSYSTTNPTIFDKFVVKNLVDKFIGADGFTNAFMLLPKSFCYESTYEDIRTRIVCKGILGAVIELPHDVFKKPVDYVLVYLRKSSVICGTKFVDAGPFVKEGVLDTFGLLFVCQDYDDEPSEHCKIIGDYTIAQSDYCLLPSIYVNPNKFNSDNEELKNYQAKYLGLIESEAKSEEKRVAHRNVSAQLSHMLGATYHKMSDAISNLKSVEGLEDTYSMLYDNFEYMKRLINSIDDDFSSQKMNFEEVAVNEFMQKYCAAWKNYGRKQFSVSFKSELNDDTTFKIDEVFLKVLLDAVLENANRHGFNGVDIENPLIQISTSYTIVNKMPCILMTIANNGAPFTDGFTIEQYVREGEFGGTSGHTGRGGFHIYQITKRHQGYMGIDSDDIWNVKINIMIPIEYYDECETNKIIEYVGEKYM